MNGKKAGASRVREGESNQNDSRALRRRSYPFGTETKFGRAGSVSAGAAIL